MSFVSQDDILELTEKMFTEMIKKLFPKKKLPKSPWPRLKYDDVMKKYETDKPDLRRDKNDNDELAFAWVIEQPLFVKQKRDDKFFHGGKADIAPSHHMFTSPNMEDEKLIDKDPLKVRSLQHDLVLNGLEVGGGSIRIHDWKLQEKVFKLLGFDKKQIKDFDHYKRAFSYGAPPHGGIAPGLDRLISILCSEKNIKEVIAFPLTGEARDPLTGAPTKVSDQQLKEVHIKTDIKQKPLPKQQSGN